MFSLRPRLELKEKEPIAAGFSRAVYELEETPDLVIKVLHEQKVSDAPSWHRRIKAQLRKLFPNSKYRFLYREYKTYLDVKITQQTRTDPLPVAELRGLVETDLGIGMLAEKVVAPTGEVGLTVLELARTKNLPELLPLLNEFTRQVYAWNIRANDLAAKNIVLGQRDEKPAFILIDGLGDPNLIPLKTWSQRVNHRSLNKRFHALARECGLVWCATTRSLRV